MMLTGDQRSFGSLLKRYRLAAGLTHEGLAERAALSARTISDLERGVIRAPRRQTLALLTEALRLPQTQQAVLEAAATPISGPRAASFNADERVGNLPVQLSRFIGRENEVRRVRALLRRDDIRLVTLTGAGGIGKTRLANRVAAGLLDDFQDGLTYVALASIADSDGAVQAIARAFDAPEIAEPSTLPALISALSSKQLLLLLDNFEHMIDAAPLVTCLLRGCPQLKVLVTSRAPLRLSGEQEFPVPPLPLPNLVHPPAVDVLMECAAVSLFVDRATRVRPDFTLTDANASTVAAICVRLDALPLAIELAANRLRLLTPRSLLSRLEDGSIGAPLRLLTSGPRDAPIRQRTLRDTISWSFNLLNDDEQRLFRRLAVFVGGCTLAAAEVIAAPTPAVETHLNVLDRLASLVDQNLVNQDTAPSNEPRFRMLETFRQFGLEELVEHGELEALRRQHACYFLGMVEETGAFHCDHKRVQALSQGEQENIQAALRWLAQQG
jgi:predicted ATPase/DNA-binding XRE family transcriptional regulator